MTPPRSASRDSDTLVILPAGVAKAASPATRHLIARLTGIPAAYIAHRGRSAEPVFLSSHRSVAKAREYARMLEEHGVQVSLLPPEQGVAQARHLSSTVVIVLALVTAQTTLLMMVGVSILWTLWLAILTAVMVIGLQVTRAPPHERARDHASRAAEDHWRALHTRAPESIQHLLHLERQAEEAQLDPETMAEMWRRLDLVGQELLQPVPSPGTLDRHLRQARSLIQLPGGSTAPEVDRQPSAPSSAAAAEAQRVPDDSP